ncbi:MAG: sensor histidine kinase [Nitrososphaerota archaeon]
MNLGTHHIQLMRYYDEVLTQSARNYIFTGEEKWVLRYKTIELLSDKLFKDAITHADIDIKPFFVTMDETNTAFVKIEHMAIDLVREGKKNDAIKILESDEYAKEKKTPAGGLEELVSIIDNKSMGILSNVMIPSVKQIIDLERKMAVLGDNISKEKLFAIGELAARLAHDIRNPLSIIKNSIEMLIDKDENIESKTLETYERIQRAIDRISYQIDDVLNFVKPRMITVSKASLNQIIATVIGRLKIPNTVKITLPEKDLWIVADVVNLEIVFVNLITNAIQAMNDSGEIEIQSHEDENNITIKVSDNGSGISKEILPRIFDPLFTTKQTGTGLGLVSCKTIIEQHEGTISVESVIGMNTTFTITLPRKISENL